MHDCIQFEQKNPYVIVTTADMARRLTQHLQRQITTANEVADSGAGPKLRITKQPGAF
jgi:hypothetical protein